MATDKSKVTEQPVVHQAPAGFVEVDIDLPTFKAELFTDRRQGTPYEDYNSFPIYGKIIECRNLGDAKDPVTGEPITNDDGEARALRMLVIELEGPLMVQGRDKTQPAFKAEAGAKIGFFPTAKILQSILAVAGPRGAAALHSAHLDMGQKVEMICNHPKKMLRIWVLPTSRGPHPTDTQKRMWNYKVQVDPKLYDRKGAQIIGSQLWDGQFGPATLGSPQLPNGSQEHTLPANG